MAAGFMSAQKFERVAADVSGFFPGDAAAAARNHVLAQIRHAGGKLGMVFDVDEMLAGQLQRRFARTGQVTGNVVLMQRVEHLPAVATGFHLGAVDAVHPRLGGMQGARAPGRARV